VRKTENRNLADFADELQPTDTVYDVGAHLGIYTRLAEQIIMEGEVISFELATQNAERLREATSSQTTVISRAVSNRSGIPYDPHNAATVGSVTTSLVEKQESSVETICLDDYENNSPNIVKIDVEEHEAEVIDGGKDTLSHEGCRVVYVETHTPDLKSEVVIRLRELGFNCIQTIDNRGKQEFIKATRTK
jgi:FkbM family methyltransferase